MGMYKVRNSPMQWIGLSGLLSKVIASPSVTAGDRFPHSAANDLCRSHLRSMKSRLSTLAKLHYVYGAFICLVGMCLLGLVGIGHLMQLEDFPEFQYPHSPRGLVLSLQWLAWCLFALVELHGLLNFISAAKIQKQRGRTFNQVVAAINCLNVPIGLALGIYTFVVLGDREVQGLYDARSMETSGVIVR